MLVVTKLDRLACSLPDARAISEELTACHGNLNLGGSVHDPTDPVGRLLFNVLAMVAEFEADLARSRTREGMKVAPRAGCVASGPSSAPSRKPTSSISTAPAGTPAASSRSCSCLPLHRLPRAATPDRTVACLHQSVGVEQQPAAGADR